MKTVNKIVVGAALAVVLAGCSDVLNPLKKETPVETGKVILSVSGTGERTILPLTPVFSKYEFIFEPLDRQQGQSNKINTGVVTEVKLAAGHWTISAIGYTPISGVDGLLDRDYPAAWGSAEEIMVSAGLDMPLTIELKPGIKTGKGVLNWDISVPDEAADSAEMRILPLEGEGTPIAIVNLKTQKQGSMSLAAGYYRVILIMNGEQPHNEVLHIYSGLTSRLRRSLKNMHAAFGSISEMAEWLSDAPDNTAATPYNIMLYKLNVQTGLSGFNGALNNRYVNLDLSACEGLNIPDNTFKSCAYLTGITLPDSVTTIGKQAFAYGVLTSVTIGNSVESIGEEAFAYNRLTNVTIPASVTSIGNEAFSGCTALENITIGNRVTSIGNRAFNSCNQLTSVTIPASVTSIGNEAFYYCSMLTSVTIGNSVTSIGDKAFANCTELTGELEIPDSVITIGNEAFANCIKFTSVTIGNRVTTIGNYAFNSCYQLTSVTIPDSVTSIGSQTFNSCTGLISVTIGNGVTTIASDVFYGCNNLRNITIKTEKATNTTSNNWGTRFPATNLVVRFEGVTSIENYAFNGCTRLVGVTIPDSVTRIGDFAFNGCNNLASEFSLLSGLNSIGSNAFENCEKLTGELVIPADMTRIGTWAFANCKKLTGVTIPDGETKISIENNAFIGCIELASVSIGNKVTSIGDNAFNGCTSLKSVTFNSTISSDNFSDQYSFPGDLRNKYLAGGIGEYTTTTPGSSPVWVKK